MRVFLISKNQTSVEVSSIFCISIHESVESVADTLLTTSTNIFHIRALRGVDALPDLTDRLHEAGLYKQSEATFIIRVVFKE